MPDLRLTYIADRVRPGSRVADIGTDHAYLPVELVKSGKCPGAIATDIRPGPLENARHSVAAAGLSAVIDVRGGDGLAPVQAHEVDDIVIAGMGGETIAAILAAAPWVKTPHYRLVLQPMSRPEELRRYLLTEGFSIESERSLCEGEHVYTVLVAAYTAAPPVTDVFWWYVGGLSPVADRVYLTKQKERLQKRADGLAGTPTGQTEASALRALIQRMEEWQ